VDNFQVGLEDRERTLAETTRMPATHQYWLHHHASRSHQKKNKKKKHSSSSNRLEINLELQTPQRTLMQPDERGMLMLMRSVAHGSVAPPRFVSEVMLDARKVGTRLAACLLRSLLRSLEQWRLQQRGLF
jgi:hypothetical protein